MEIPENAKTHLMRTSIIWFDEDGILYSTPLPNAPLTSTNEEIKEDMDKFRKLIDNKKVSMVIESDPNRPAPPREQRDLIDQELHTVVKAMAIITTSAVSKMIANLFFSFKPPRFPMKMFTDVKEAVEWIKEINKKLDSDINSRINFLVA